MNKKYESYSTVAKGMDFHQRFYQSLQNFHKVNGGSINLIEVKANYNDNPMDERVPMELLVKKDKKFSRHIKIVYIDGLRAETGSAVNRLAGFCGIEETLIAGGMRIGLKSLPSYPNEKGERVPRFVATTGSMVYPKYKNTATGREAHKFHEVGAVILVRLETGESEFTHVKAKKDGSFSYYGTTYHPDGRITQEKNISSVLGDLHPISVDKKALNASLAILADLKVEDVFLNDADDFRNNQSHHIKDLNNTKAKLFLEGKLELKKEQSVNYDVIKKIQDTVKGKTYVNKSNHDEHRDHAIERGDYITDPTSYEPLHIQALLKLYGADTFQSSLVAEEAVRQALKQIAKNLQNHDYNSEVKVKLDQGLTRTVFLDRTSLMAVNGKMITSKHGDDGVGGARGSTKTFAGLGMAGVYGHGHFEEWYNGIIRVATLSKTNMDYNEGQPTNWSHSIVLVYEDGIGQIVRIRNGKIIF